jgi:hypothetical protein
VPARAPRRPSPLATFLATPAPGARGALAPKSHMLQAEGEGFEPPRAWRPLRFSRAPIDVLFCVVECRLEHDSRRGCGNSLPPGAVSCRRGGGIGGGTRRAQTGEPIHVMPSSKARRPCHCQRAAQMAEQRQISRHAHAVDELGTRRSAPARSASPTPGCVNLPRSTQRRQL